MAKRNKFNSGKTQENLMARNLDELAKFDDFKESVLPLLQKMIKQGKSAVDMYKAVESLAAARSITIALTDEDSAKALAGVREILDRSHGKATEHKKLEARFSNMPEADLDALLQAEQEDLENIKQSKH